MLQNASVQIKVIIESSLDGSEILQKITKHDYIKSLNGLVHMIHSFDLDMEQFSRGVILPLQHGNGDQALVAAKPLMAEDLVNIAEQAVQFGYLGTAAAVLKVNNIYCIFPSFFCERFSAILTYHIMLHEFCVFCVEPFQPT